MKKLFTYLLSILCFMCVFGAVSVEASILTPTFKVGEAEGAVGETVTIDVSYEHKPRIISFKVMVGYDASVLRLVAIDGKDVDDVSFGPLNANPIAVNWVDTIRLNNIKQAVAARLTFQIISRPDSGETAVTVDYDPEDVFDDDYQNVTFAKENGRVKIKNTVETVEGISLDKETLTLKTGERETLTAILFPSNKTDLGITYESSDSSVVKVLYEGKIEAVKEGTATITATSPDKYHQDTCVVTVVCAHAEITTHPANPSSCNVQGNAEYVTCNVCNRVISGSSEKLPLEAHQGSWSAWTENEEGLRTCSRVCSVCSQTETLTVEVSNDSETQTMPVIGLEELAQQQGISVEMTIETKEDAIVKEGKDAIVYEIGTTDNIQFFEIALINSLNQMITDTGNVILEIPLSFDAKDKKDIVVYRYHDRNVETFEKLTQRAVDNYRDGTFYVDEAMNTLYIYSNQFSTYGVHYAKVSDVIVGCEHNYGELVEKVETSHNNSGMNAYYQCSVCGKYFTENLTETTKDALVIPQEAHDTIAVWKTDDNKHYKECSCGVHLEEANHNFVWITDKLSTENESGLKHEECSVCGKMRNENTIIQVIKPTTEVEDSKDEAPNTADNNPLLLWICLLLCSVCVYVGIIVKKYVVIK